MKNFLLLLGLGLCMNLFGQVKEDNIILTSSSESYTFHYNKKRNAVEVKEEINNIYTCTRYRGEEVFVQFFDEQSLLDGVELTENGNKSYAHTQLKNYNVEDIFYSDAKIYVLPLKFSKVGAQNKVQFKKTILDPRYFCTVYFSERSPVIEKTVSVFIPKWMNVEIKEFNFEGYDVKKEISYSAKDDANIIKYTIKNLAARSKESNQPGSSYFLPHLLFLNKSASVNGSSFTYFNTLKDQYAWYYQLTNALKKDEASIKSKALEITKTSSSDIEKIKAVLYWIYDNIRYIAFEDGIAGFKPDEAQNVLSKKYGDCKGMANLTKELLRALGFDARLAWLGTNSIAYSYSTPSLCVDNHMITCLIYKDKKYFLDGTETFLAFEKYAERIQGRPVLIEDGANYILETIPVTKVDQNWTKFNEIVSIKNEKLVGHVEYLFRGECKEKILNNINASKKETLESQLEKYISNNNKNYLIKGLKTNDLNKIDGDLLLDFTLVYDGAVSVFGNEMYVDLDYNKTFDQAYIDTAVRKTDFCFSYKNNYHTEVLFEIPEGYTISSVPASFVYDHADFYFDIRYKKDGNQLKYTKDLQIKNATLKRIDFLKWNEAIKKLSQIYQDQVILIKR